VIPDKNNNESTISLEEEEADIIDERLVLFTVLALVKMIH